MLLIQSAQFSPKCHKSAGLAEVHGGISSVILFIITSSAIFRQSRHKRVLSGDGNGIIREKTLSNPKSRATVVQARDSEMHGDNVS